MDTWLGKMGLSCISMALSDFYASHGHYKTRLVPEIRNSKRDVVGAAAAGTLSLSLSLSLSILSHIMIRLLIYLEN